MDTQREGEGRRGWVTNRGRGTHKGDGHRWWDEKNTGGTDTEGGIIQGGQNGTL